MTRALIWIHGIVLTIIGLKAAGNVLFALRRWDIDRGVSQDRLDIVAGQLVLAVIVGISMNMLITRKREQECARASSQGSPPVSSS